MNRTYRNLLIALFIVIFIVGIFILIPMKLMLWIITIAATIFYINLWLVSICTIIIDKKYDSNFDVFYRIILMIVMSLGWGIICWQ